MATAHVFQIGDVVVPRRVLFGGLECEAFEMIANGVGICIRTKRRAVKWGDALMVMQETVRAGSLACDSCGDRWNFAEGGQVFVFPFAPMPGWMVWNPGVLTDDTDEIRPKVRCARCSAALALAVHDVFDYRLAL